MGHYTFQSFIAEYPSGRYAHAHAHSSGAVLLCVKGKGYTLTWPADAGTRPYESGNGHLVRRQEYGPGGLVSAAPGGGDWFHQHFSVGSDPLRVHAFLGPPTRPTGRLSNVVPGKDEVTLDVDVKQGGSTIEYPDEDPQIRKDLIEVLEREGVEFTMPEEVFQR